ncbi:MFS general substrate transporter [Ramicandelaber brevisporus]|nr:MFS general substrate transporter [Ramicandelaber brevisporus]
MAFSQSFQGLLVLRVLLGCAEAGLVPGCIYYLSFWFCKNEQATTTAIFMAAPSVSGIIGGFLASAIGHMHGTAGWSAWRWLFLLEGLPSFVLCAVVLIWLPNYPATAKFLSEKERAYAASRIEHDSHGQSKERDSESAPVTTKDDEEHTGEQQSQLQQQQQQQQHSEVVLSKERKRELFWQEVRATVFDWYNIAICICKFCYVFIGYSFTLLLPTLLHKLGFKATDAQLLTVPRAALALIALFVLARISDIKGVRSIYLIIGGSLSSALFLALTIMGEHGLWSKYVLLIISCVPTDGLGPIITAWGATMNNRSATVPLPSSNDTNGHLDEKDNQERLIQLEEYREATKVRLATFTAIMFMSSNIGGIVSGFSFPEWDAPGYRFSQGINASLMIVYTVLIIAMHISIKRFNSRQPPSAWTYPI